MDVIALAQHGISYATATLGTATSHAHLERVYRLCPEVVFCFDGDEAGRLGAGLARDKLAGIGITTRLVHLPEDTKPDGLSVEALHWLVDGMRALDLAEVSFNFRRKEITNGTSS